MNSGKHGLRTVKDGFEIYDTREPNSTIFTKSRADAYRLYFGYLSVLGMDTYDAHKVIHRHDMADRKAQNKRKKK